MVVIDIAASATYDTGEISQSVGMSSKVIILGTPYSGKTTLCKAMRKRHPKYPILELDEELTKANGNQWPADFDFRNRVVLPRVFKKVMRMKKILFFTSGYDLETLKQAKKDGFKILQLFLYKKQIDLRLDKRQKERNRNYFLNREDQEIIRRLGLVDRRINSFGPVNSVVQRIEKYSEINFA